VEDPAGGVCAEVVRGGHAVSITIRSISKSFGVFAALREVDLDVSTGDLVVLLGPSGSGKTTLLRVIAGLECADAGTIALHGEDVTALGPRERRVGFVFQHYALFRHLSVFENVAFGLRVRPRGIRPAEAVIRATVHELLRRMQLGGTEQRYPGQLSGGQQQRVALARTLAVEPRVLLLDEPFGSLDANVRKDLRRWIRSLHDDLGITTVLVTHDQDEAFDLADRVAVLRDGRIQQVGTPEDLYHQPASQFVRDFLGEVKAVSAHPSSRTVRIASSPYAQAVARDSGSWGAGTVTLRS